MRKSASEQAGARSGDARAHGDWLRSRSSGARAASLGGRPRLEVAALAIATGCTLALVHCTKASESNDAKRMPKPPPAPSAEISPGLRIVVTVDGAPSAAIDAARLAQTKPDFEEEDRKAWRLSTLLGPDAARPGVAMAVTGEKGVTLVARPPKAKEDPIAVLNMNRRGEVHVSLVPGSDPFPAYHGRGGRLNRPGDPLPRLSGITEIRVYKE